MRTCSECGAKYPDEVQYCPADGTRLGGSAKKPDSLLGKIVDKKYKIIERLGSGGMGAVYKAEHALMERIVALKMIHPHLADGVDDDVFMKRFISEAKTASKVSNPHVVTIHDFGIDNDVPYLVMEYNEGQSLQNEIEAEAPLELPRVLHIARQIAEALEAAHKAGIIHRDLKPDNIMLSKDDEGRDFVQVLDFGIAKVLSADESGSERMTKTGKVIGTPQYMSPEQMQGKELDYRSDLYALGVIVYEMLAGRVPFQADSLVELISTIATDAPIPLHVLETAKGVPAGLERAVLKALEKEPNDRQQSFAEFVQDLEQGTGVQAARSTPSSVPPEVPEKKTPSRSPLMLAAGVLVPGVLLVVMTVIRSQPSADPKPEYVESQEVVFQGPVHLGELITSLSSKNEDVSLSAMEALAEQGVWIIPVLQELFPTVASEVKQRVLKVYTSIGTPRAAQALSKHINDKDTAVRNRSRASLRQIGTPEALAALVDKRSISNVKVEPLLPKGYSGSIEPGQVALILEGPIDELDKLDKQSLTVVADGRALKTEGSHLIALSKVKETLGETIVVSRIKPEEARVTLVAN